MFYPVTAHNLWGTFICSITANNGWERRHAQGVKRAAWALSPAHRTWLGVGLAAKSAGSRGRVGAQFSPVFFLIFGRF